MYMYIHIIDDTMCIIYIQDLYYTWWYYVLLLQIVCDQHGPPGKTRRPPPPPPPPPKYLENVKKVKKTTKICNFHENLQKH